eukprot:scaffold1293_cov375-Prasinococcus_capsulatus_cf.AAC.2
MRVRHNYACFTWILRDSTNPEGAPANAHAAPTLIAPPEVYLHWTPVYLFLAFALAMLAVDGTGCRARPVTSNRPPYYYQQHSHRM